MKARQTEESTALSQAIDVGFIETDKAEFYQTPGGFTALRYKDKEYKRVSLRRALPVGKPDVFISVADHENKEICVIRSLEDLSEAQRRIVSGELERRYYCPEVLSIQSVKDKMGYVYLEMRITGRGDGRGEHDKSCAVKDVNKNIRLLDDKRLLIMDVDGNRYIIPSLDNLDKKSLKRLEPYLF